MPNPVVDLLLVNWQPDAPASDSNRPITSADFMNSGAPEDLAGNVRLLKSMIRQESLNKQWERWLGVLSPYAPDGAAPVYVDATHFTVVGDWTVESAGFYPAIATVGRRLKATVSAGTIYGYISAASFGGGLTTVTCVWDSGALDAGFSEVQYGTVQPANLANSTIPQDVETQRRSPRIANLAGAANVYTCTFVPAITALSQIQGLPVTVKVNTANTGASTLAPNGLAATAIKKWQNGSLVDPGANELPTAGYVVLVYDGSVFQLLGTVSAAGAIPTATSTTGTTAYAATLSPAITALAAGVLYLVKITNTNTAAAPTMAFNGLTAKTMVRGTGSTIQASDLVAGSWHLMVYDAVADQISIVTLARGDRARSTWCASFIGGSAGSPYPLSTFNPDIPITITRIEASIFFNGGSQVGTITVSDGATTISLPVGSGAVGVTEAAFTQAYAASTRLTLSVPITLAGTVGVSITIQYRPT